MGSMITPTVGRRSGVRRRRRPPSPPHALAAALAALVAVAALAVPPASAAPAPLLVLGDSLCVGASRDGDLRGALRRELWDPELVCRIGEPLAWGIERVRERASVPRTVVVALGTNPGPALGNFRAEARTMLAELEARGAEEVVWMTFAHRDGGYAAKSQVVRDLAGASAVDALRVADWAPVVHANPHWFAPDGLHHTFEGRRAWASFLASQVSAADAFAPFASVDDLIRRQYQDLLQRQPDPGGAASWEHALRSGRASRDAFVTALVRSPELAGRLAPIARLYLVAHQRDPDAAGLRHWARSELPLQAMADGFVSSPEFEQRHGGSDDDAFVTQLYRAALGREPDPAGLEHWRGVLASGAGRAAVVLGFAGSPEFVARSATRVEVAMLYVGLLGRQPDPPGRHHWEVRLAQGTAFEDVVAGFLDSVEYRRRLEGLGLRTTSR